MKTEGKYQLNEREKKNKTYRRRKKIEVYKTTT